MPVLQCYSAIWSMEGYYDTTVVEREARKLLLSRSEHSVTKSLQDDGTELIEMPLNYNKYAFSHGLHGLSRVCNLLKSLCKFVHILCHLFCIIFAICHFPGGSLVSSRTL